MYTFLRRGIPALLALSTFAAHGQFYKLHGASLSAGGFGQFNTELESNPTPVTVPLTTPVIGSTQAQNQQEFTTGSAGALVSLQFHPVSWAGIEMNYGYTRYSEKYSFDYANRPTVISTADVPVNQQEATGAYLFHPKHIRFQPFVGIGGGAIDFDPAFASQRGGSNQWRGAGLLEMGFDLPTPSKHIQFRVEGRSLYYRAPNFYTAILSTRSWRVQSEPVVSAVYRF